MYYILILYNATKYLCNKLIKILNVPFQWGEGGTPSRTGGSPVPHGGTPFLHFGKIKINKKTIDSYLVH